MGDNKKRNGCIICVGVGFVLNGLEGVVDWVVYLVRCKVGVFVGLNNTSPFGFVILLSHKDQKCQI